MSSDKLSRLQEELLITFLEEAAEGLARLESGLLELEREGDPSSVVHDIFRAAHSIKGGAGTFGLGDITDVAHAMETLLDHWREGARITQAAVQLALEGVDALRNQLDAAQRGVDFDSAIYAELRSKLLDSATVARASLPPKARASMAPIAAIPPRDAHTWRICFRPLPHMLRTGNDSVLLLRELHNLGRAQVVTDTSALPEWSALDPEVSYLSFVVTLATSAAEATIRDIFSWVDGDCELSIDRVADAKAAPHAVVTVVGAGERAVLQIPQTPDSELALGAAPAAPPGAGAPAQKQAQKAADTDSTVASLRVSVDKIDLLMNMVGELVITQSMLGELEHDDGPVDLDRVARIREGLGQLARNTRALQESVMQLRSTPISAVFSRFPRVVHDISRRMGKEIELRIAGESTELDKTVMEKLGDPLVHLVRNSLDHGLETPEERLAAGKPRAGTLTLNAFHRGGDIVIEVSDDGRGLNLERILEKARKQGLVGADQQLTDAEIRNLVFAPGFSTADQLSDISGRGVGMDVVRRNVKALGGSLSLESTMGVGTKVSLRLPLTLAIVDGQLVRIGGKTYVIPLLSIVESVQVESNLVHQLAGRWELYRLRDAYIPMVDLGALLGISRDVDRQHHLMVIVEGDGERIGLRVDDLLGQQQVVIKSLEANYKQVPGLSGATILGDGNVALIIDVVGVGRLVRHETEHSAEHGDARYEHAAE